MEGTIHIARRSAVRQVAKASPLTPTSNMSLIGCRMESHISEKVHGVPAIRSATALERELT